MGQACDLPFQVTRPRTYGLLLLEPHLSLDLQVTNYSEEGLIASAVKAAATCHF